MWIKVFYILKYRIINSGDKEFGFHVLLHNYFDIDDVYETTIEGLKDKEYNQIDIHSKVNDKKFHIPPGIDGVFPCGGSIFTINKKNGNKIQIIVNEPKENNVVVWNAGVYNNIL